MKRQSSEHPSITFLKALYQHCDEGFINLRFLAKDPANKFAMNKFVPLDEIDSIPAILETHNNQNVHFGVATRIEGDGSKNGIIQTPALWVDVDMEDLPEEKKDEIRQRYQDFPLKPSFLLNSGGGIHIYWLLKAPASKEEIPQVENLLKRLASYFNGDMGSTDASRVLRIPKTLNYKYTPPREVTVMVFKPQKEYNLSDFDFLPQVEDIPNGEEKCLPPGWEKELLEGVSEGERNNAITRLAGRYIGKGLSREEILPILLDANSRFNPPLPVKDVEVCLDSVVKTDKRNHPDNEGPFLEMIEQATLETLPEILKGLSNLKETERAVYVNALAKKLKIRKSAIEKDLVKLTRHEEPDIERLLEGGANPESHYSAQNFIDGILSFGAILGDHQRVIVQSDGEVILANDDNFRFRRSLLTADAIKRFRNGEDISGRDLIERLKNLFNDHIVFKDDRIPLLLSIWGIGTYLFKIFHFYGYLFINSPVKRCGKSLLLDVLSFVCFNSTPRMVNPSESSTFREVNDNDATLVIDEVESLSDADREKRPEMIALLDAGFQRGAQVSRTETKNREFVVRYFSAYCPKVLAGIKGIADTIEDRCFKIVMARKVKSEAVKRFNLRLLKPHIDKIREDIFIWALKYGNDVAQVYDGTSEVPGTEGFDDRLKDILEPLLSIASVIDAQADDSTFQTVKALLGLSKDMGKGREATEDLNSAIPATVAAMRSLIDGAEERFVSADELFERFRGKDDLGFIKSKRGMAFFLSKLEIHRTQPRRVGEKTVRGYVLSQKHLDDLGARYA